MEDVLRWSLVVVGSCAIIGVALHGIWVSRKNSEQKTKKNSSKPVFQTEQQFEITDSLDSESNNEIDLSEDVAESAPIESIHEPKFDDLGVGSVRVVSAPLTEEPNPEFTELDIELSDNKNLEGEVASESKTEQKSNSKSGKIYASVVTQPKPEYTKKSDVSVVQNSNVKPTKVVPPNTDSSKNTSATKTSVQASTSSIIDGYQAPEPPPFLLKKEALQDVAATNKVQTDTLETTKNKHEGMTTKEDVEGYSDDKPTLTEQARNLVKRKKAESTRKRREPKLAEDQLRIDFDDEETEQADKTEQKASVKQQPKIEQPQEVLVLNVKTPEGEPISGAALLPMLLTLGFKFGEQDIFHRHVNSNGKGPVLFSLANMFKPGVFDIDNLENFTTQGVSLFMILPIEGEPHQVFNMMHNAARKISEEFSAQIYDGKRSLLTKQSLQQYVEKIREFERQRMVNNG
ncbi:MAG: cell division protein ZipA [Paraglaciecola sp.]|uniref:cell division protein ZipA n=1 Tax=Paraglaciecola sp. TaxID=1920173 RepID=UPI003296880D